MEKRTHSIAVIGMSCWYPGAPNLKQLWENVLTRRRQFRRTPDKRLSLANYYDPNPIVPDKTYGKWMAVLDGFEFDWAGRRIPKPMFESADIVHWLALEMALQALADAGYTPGSVPSEQTGVVVGNTLTGEMTRSLSQRLRWPYVARSLQAAGTSMGMDSTVIESLEKLMESYYKQPLPPINQDSLAGFLSNTIAGRICNFLDLHGGGYTVDGACSSSLISLATAAQNLANGDLNLAIAGGVDISLDAFEMVGFAKTKALTSKDMSVYDLHASGFIPGEGCGFVILKRLEDARRDGDYVYAVLKGWGISSDGAGVGITAPSAKGQAIALRRAYEKAGYSPQTLDFVEGHGTGTPVGDRTELKGIAIAIDDPEAKRSCGVTSLKSIIGHTKAAAGIGGFIKAAMAVNRRVLPPTAGCQEPNEIFDTAAKGLYPILQGECQSTDTILRAGVSAMGFGGSNCHVTLESGDAPSAKLQPSLSESELLVSNQTTELFVFSAESVEALQDQVEDVRAIAMHLSEGDLVDFAVDRVRNIDPQHPIRASVVAGKAEELVESLQWLDQTLMDAPPAVGEPRGNVLQTVWLSNGLSSGGHPKQVGFLFPGQGSQRLNMARVLVERYPWAKELVEKADGWLESLGCQPVSSYIYRPLDRVEDQAQLWEWKRALSQTEIAQPAICLTSLIWIQYLQRLGIAPVAVGGHSLGELTAFYAAGAFDEKALIELAAMRGRAMATSPEKTGTMASLGCDQLKTQDLVNQVNKQIDGEGGDRVVLANINSPTQTVISGTQDAVESVVELALEEGFQARLLPVSNAFHSSFVADAAVQIRQSAPIPDHLDTLAVPLFSSCNGELIQEGIDLKEHFGQQIVDQVNFISLVEAMSAKCSILLEVGSGKVLSGLGQSIVSNSNNGASSTLCFPVEGRAGQDQDLNTTIAAIFIHGGTINWTALYENRLVREWLWPRQFLMNPCEKPFEPIAPPADTVGYGIPTQLTSLTDLSAQAFTHYLDTRGEFLADVIKADLRHWPSASDSSADATEEVVSTDIEVSEDGSAINADSIKPETTNPDVDQQVIEDFILEKIVQETGYSKDSIPLSARLLDDLRLESIKAGEIIGGTAAQFGVAGKVEPPELANSTISEIAAAIYNAMVNGEDSSTQNNHEPTWVRTFGVQSIPEDLPADALNDSDWNNAHCLIAHDHQEDLLVQSLVRALEYQGSRVTAVSFADANNPDITNLAKFSHLIAILPPLRQYSTASEEETLTTIINRLNTFTAPPTVDNRHYSEMTVAYIQFGGGYLSAQYKGGALERGCAKAITATLHLERPDLKVRVIDFDAAVFAPAFTERVIQELSTSETYTAVGFNQFLQRLIPRPVVQELADYDEREISWTGEDVILVTGGGKGITAECALALAEATGVRMALVGRSPAPTAPTEHERAHLDQQGQPNKIVQTLERFEAKGLTCRYYQCDVANLHSVRQVVNQIQQDMGAITGVVHGAAVNHPRALNTVTPSEVMAEISPKLKGVLNLCHILQDKPPKLFVGLSSIIGFTGIQRNGWYGFSNEAMELTLQKFGANHPQTQILSIGYSVWDEVGMGFETGAVQSLRHMGIGAISKKEGVRRFLSLVQHHPVTEQILVTGPMRTLATSTAEFKTWNPPMLPYPRTSKLIEIPGTNEPGVAVIRRSHLTLENQPYLKDHIYKGSYLFPTVFGLEAMAEAVALVTGNDHFEAVRIEDISLERGIVVDPEKGTLIEVRTQVIERQTKADPRRVQAEIRTELSGFTKAHFSATFVLDVNPDAPLNPIALPDTPLDIRPDEDLYGPLLFQGPLFQRLHQFYEVSGDTFDAQPSQRTLFTAHQYVPSEENLKEGEEQWLLGDLYLRDSLLQSGQTTSPQDLCLPIGFSSWELYQPCRPGTRLLTGAITPNAREEDERNVDLVVVDEFGYVVEKLTGYRLKVLERQPQNPTPEEFAYPDQRDQAILQAKLKEISDQFEMVLPEVAVMNVPRLHHLSSEERHNQERPLLQKVIGTLIDNSLQPTSDCSEQRHDICWLESGKPTVQLMGLAKTEKDADISLAHDDRMCLAVAGYGAQGCDLEPIHARPQDAWLALLGHSRQQMLQQLSDQDSLDRAGTRIWTVLEALVKAQHLTQDADLLIERWVGDSIVFKLSTSAQQILTFPIQFTRGRERVMAMVVYPKLCSISESQVAPDSENQIVLTSPRTPHPSSLPLPCTHKLNLNSFATKVANLEFLKAP